MRLPPLRLASVRHPALAAAVLLAGTCAAISGEWVSGIKWQEPPVVTPGKAGGPPSDAVVLFDGKDLSQWNDGSKWKIVDGVATAAGGGISTKESFGDCQLHIEWASPKEVSGSGQGRGNSGVYFMGRYEIQILDSFKNPTYVDGQAASLYKTKPPLVNATLPPGEWQTYDIVFNAPRFNEDKSLKMPGYVTVLHNGVLVQNHTEILGQTAWDSPPHYTAHPERQPLQLQFHGNPVQFRNIWIREIPDLKSTKP